MVKQAIIPLAGLGTRLLPLSSVIPKELLPINGKPNLEYIMEECIQAGIKQFIFVHGHLHVPREESIENLTILCQGATGLPFDEDQRGAIGFLTVGDSFKWDVVRFEYNQKSTIDLLEKRQPPFYKNLQNTVRYAAIKND